MWLWVIHPLTITFSDHWCYFTSGPVKSGSAVDGSRFQVQEFPETVSQVSPRVSTEAERPQQPRGTAARPLWWICCSRCGKSGPSWQRRRKPSCPTRQKWKAHRWAGPPVPSGASLPSLHTSSPESPPCPCWRETRTSNRLRQGFKGSACNHMRDCNPVVSLKIPTHWWDNTKVPGKAKRSPNLRCLLIPHPRCEARCVQVCSRGVGELWFYRDVPPLYTHVNFPNIGNVMQVLMVFDQSHGRVLTIGCAWISWIHGVRRPPPPPILNKQGGGAPSSVLMPPQWLLVGLGLICGGNVQGKYVTFTGRWAFAHRAPISDLGVIVRSQAHWYQQSIRFIKSVCFSLILCG